MFGNVPIWPQNETTPFQPRSPYGYAKLFAHWATVNYREAFGLHASSGILFNHESPLRGPEFVTRKITLGFARLARAAAGPSPSATSTPIATGASPATMSKACGGCSRPSSPDDYVLATGVSTSVRDFVSHAARPFGWKIAWRGERPR